MIKYIFLESVKKRIANVFLIFLYVIIWAALLFSCLIKKAKNFVQKQSRFSFTLETLETIIQSKKWKYIFIWKNSCFLKKEKNVENNKEQDKDYSTTSTKEYTKVPKHVYIVLKNNDVSIINKKKLLHYFLDIITYLYELKIKHLTIYTSESFFTNSFYDDLTQKLFEYNFFMKPLINKDQNSISYGSSNQFVITKFKYTLYQNKNAIQKSVQKLFPLKNKYKKSFAKTKYMYEKDSLHLIFMNKENGHKKIIEAVQKNTLHSKGEMLQEDKLKIWNEKLEETIKVLLNSKKKKNYNKETKLQQIYHVLHLLENKKNYIFIKIKNFFTTFKKKVIYIFLRGENHMINVDRHSNFYSKCNKKKKDIEFNVDSDVTANGHVNVDNNILSINKNSIQNERTNVSDQVSINIEENKKTEDTNSLKVIFELLDNLIFQEKETIETIKNLIFYNIPLYVKPIPQDIFTYSNNNNGYDSSNNGKKTFGYVTVDMVISLRIGMIDYLLSFMTNYKKEKYFLKEHFFNFMFEYFSSFFFLYDIVHPFRKNGIQPWVLSESELYEFFSFNVKSIKKALAYYNSSIQRFGY